MSRLEFSAKTKKAAYERSKGNCEECTAQLRDGFIEYDHVVECALGGDNSLDNCRVLCRTCHKAKTRERAPVLAKAERNWRRARGIRPPSRFQGSKTGPLKRAWDKYTQQWITVRRDEH